MWKLIRYLAVALVAAALAGCAMGGGPGAPPGQGTSDLASRASSVLQRQMSFPPKNRVPEDLVNSARCIAVFPSVVKAGLIVGGRSGKGLVSCRQSSGGWSNAAPAVYTLRGGSIGLQAGVQKSSIILLFMTRQSTQALLEGGVKLGAGLGVTAGPLGFNADVSHTTSPVLAYVTSKKGLYAGVDLSGTALNFDDPANARLYGGSKDAQGILFGTSRVPPTVSMFTQTLKQYAP